MRILLADDRSPVRHALRVLLERQQGLEVTAEAVSAEDLLSKAEASPPDVLLLDWDLPGMCIDELLPAVRSCCVHTRIIVLSGQPSMQAAALAAGADAFVSKAYPPDQLLSAINESQQALRVHRMDSVSRGPQSAGANIHHPANGPAG